MSDKALVGVIMGSHSDWDVMKNCTEKLEEFNIPYLARVISAHRTPQLLDEFTANAEEQGLQVIIAAAGGAAHLPGVTAAKTTLPVLGVPMQSKTLGGLDSLLSIVQMPAGIPVGTLAIGKAGAVNAALYALAILALKYPGYQEKLKEFREQQTRRGEQYPDPKNPPK